MCDADQEKKEIRAQRHDFIKEYYKMATMDLDRHLKGGWQTIAVLAGGAAILAAGHEEKIGLPVATTIALASAFWGALTVIDANYWSLRAIGFLANIESVYFTVGDRKAFNPYVGRHPSFHLLNSLLYLFWLCLLFGCAAMLNLAWEVTNRYPSVPLFFDRLGTIGPRRFAFYGFPIIAAAWGSLWVFGVYRKRLQDYASFSSGSPGPGVVVEPDAFRHVNFQPVCGLAQPALETGTQDGLSSQLSRRKAHLDRWWKPATAACSLFTCLYAGWIIVKACKAS